MAMEVADPKVEYDMDGFQITRFEDQSVLIDPPDEGQVHLNGHGAFMLATFIFGTDPDREPYCCAGDG